jgi:hypothetical protein
MGPALAATGVSAAARSVPGSRTKTDQLTTPARFNIVRPVIPFGKALTSHQIRLPVGHFSVRVNVATINGRLIAA